MSARDEKYRATSYYEEPVLPGVWETFCVGMVVVLALGGLAILGVIHLIEVALR